VSKSVIRTSTGIFAAAICVMLAGCGVQGEAYQARATPASQSLVYIYRPYEFLTSQSTPMITCGHESIELEPGGFDEFVEDSGPVTCGVAGDTTTLRFDARAGEKYFIKQYVDSSGLSTHVRLVLMDADVGADEIRDCRRQGIKD
jgi:hypothetical protein